jgi:hypothetical protein
MNLPQNWGQGGESEHFEGEQEISIHVEGDRAGCGFHNLQIRPTLVK